MKTKKVKAFDHDYPEKFNYDPEDGEELWEEEDYCILDIPEELSIMYSKGCDFTIGIFSEGDMEIDPDTLSSLQGKIKGVLDVHELGDKGTFGLWVEPLCCDMYPPTVVHG